MNELALAITNFGALGIIAGWLMFRFERRIERIEASVDRVSRALMLELVGREATSPMVRRQAQQLLAELDAARAKRTGSPVQGEA